MTALTVVPVLVLPLLLVLQKLEHWALEVPGRKKPRRQPVDEASRPLPVRQARPTR